MPFESKDLHFADTYFANKSKAEKEEGLRKTAQAKADPIPEAKETPSEVEAMPWDKATIVPPSDVGSAQKKMFEGIQAKLKKAGCTGGVEINEETYKVLELEKSPTGANLVKSAKSVYAITIPTCHPGFKRTVRAAVFYDATKRDPVQVEQGLWDERDHFLPFTAQTIDGIATSLPAPVPAKGNLVTINESGEHEEVPCAHVEEAKEALAARGIKVSARWIDRCFGDRYGCLCQFVEAPTAQVVDIVKKVDAALAPKKAQTHGAGEDAYDARAEEKKKPSWKSPDYDERASEKGSASSSWKSPDYDERASQKLKDSAYTGAYGSESAMLKYDKKVSGRGAPESVRKAQSESPRATDEPYAGSAKGKPGAAYAYPDADTRKPGDAERAKIEAPEDVADAPRATEDPYDGEARKVTKFTLPEDAFDASKEADQAGIEKPKEESDAPRATEDPYKGEAKPQKDVFTSGDGGKASNEAPDLSPEAKARKARKAAFLSQIRRLRAQNAAALAARAAAQKRTKK